MSVEQYMTVTRTIDPETLQWFYTVQTSAFKDLFKTTRNHHMFVRGARYVVPTGLYPQEQTGWCTEWKHLSLAGYSSWVPPKVASQLDIAVQQHTQVLRNPTDKWHGFLSDVLVTAVEGGSGYWSSIMEYNHPGEDDLPNLPYQAWVVEGDDTGEAASRDCSDINPVLNGKKCEGHLITFDTLEKGIEMLRVVSPLNYTSHHIEECANEKDASMIDADGADLIVQMGLFGDIVYG